MTKFKVIIVGSGLAGSLLANGLINKNVEVEVYERLARDAKREGYQIRLGVSALMGLRTCLTEEQKHEVVKRFGRTGGKFAAAPIVYDKDFNVMLNTNRLPSYEKSAPISRKVLRDILAEPLHQAGKLFYGKTFQRYEILNSNTRDEKVVVHFDDGASSQCDILVAADGSHSKINSQIGLNNLKTLDSHWSFLAKADLPTSQYLKMPEELIKSPLAVSSDQRSLYFCVYLPDKLKAKIPEQSATTASHEIDDSHSSCFFGFVVPTTDVPSDIRKASTEEQWSFISQQFADHWSPKYVGIIELLRGKDLHAFQGRVGTRPPANWRIKAQANGPVQKGHSRVLLVGDAIHAMLPNRGMGGNQAMRDTAVLLPILVDVAHKHESQKYLSKADVDEACKKYEDEMIPRTFDWVRKSGGDSWIVADSNTLTGWSFMYALGLLMDVAYACYWLSSFVYTSKWVDEAPELQD